METDVAKTIVQQAKVMHDTDLQEKNRLNNENKFWNFWMCTVKIVPQEDEDEEEEEEEEDGQEGFEEEEDGVIEHGQQEHEEMNAQGNDGNGNETGVGEEPIPTEFDCLFGKQDDRFFVTFVDEKHTTKQLAISFDAYDEPNIRKIVSNLIMSRVCVILSEMPVVDPIIHYDTYEYGKNRRCIWSSEDTLDGDWGPDDGLWTSQMWSKLRKVCGAIWDEMEFSLYCEIVDLLKVSKKYA